MSRPWSISKERSAAAFTNTARYVTRPFGPAIGSALMQIVAFGAAGVLKSVYDLVLWRVFRRVPLPEDAADHAG